ncbi:hypothetical protein ACFE04_017022 [Oxalis oulophora]
MENNIMNNNIDSKLKENNYKEKESFLVPESEPYSMKEFHFEAPSSKGLIFLQDFQHLDHQQFHHSNNDGSNNMFMTDSFETSNFHYGGSSTNNFDFYECKPFVENINTNNTMINGGHGLVMDNFQSGSAGGGGGYLNNNYTPSRFNFLDKNNNIVGSDHQMMNFDFQQVIKPVSFVAADEVSSSVDKGYLKKMATNNNNKNKNIMAKKIWKSRKKSNNLVKGQWTIDEDRLLIKLVDQYGLRKWSHIAQMLPGRIGKQCRERWHNHLRPDIKKDTWSEEEDKVLIESHAEIGNKWAEIAKRLPGRTENSIKNHWNATKRRQFSKRKCRSKYPRGSILQDYIKSLNLNSSNNTTSLRAQQKPSSSSATILPNHMITSSVNPQQGLICATDRLVPSFDDFAEVPEFDFDEKMLQENCTIDSLLDDIPCVKENVIMPPPPPPPLALDFQIKKELDLMEMISQANL